MRKYILLILFIVLIIIAIFFVLNYSNLNQKKQNDKQENIGTLQEAFLSKTGSYCEYLVNADSVESWVLGTSQKLVNNQEGNVIYTISTDKKIYTWNNNETIGIVTDQPKVIFDNIYPSDSPFIFDKNITGLKCKKIKLDQSFFDIPKNINFRYLETK